MKNKGAIEKDLLEALKKAGSDQALLKDFLEDLLTPAEYKAILTRWQVVIRLMKGEPQRSIAKDLKIGIATVTRGSREISDTKGGFARVLKKLGK